MEIQTFTRKWGNSIAVIIPSEIVEKKNIKENQEILITFEKTRPKARTFFGAFPNWKKSTQEMKDEMRKAWLSESDRKKEAEWAKREKKK